VLYFPRLGFELLPEEQLLTPALLARACATSASDADGRLKGVAATKPAAAAAAMIGRFRSQARQLIDGCCRTTALAAHGADQLSAGAGRDARAVLARRRPALARRCIPVAPNYGERILRVFTNRQSRKAHRASGGRRAFRGRREALPAARQAVLRWQARLLQALHVTKSFRSEYDHLMLQLHDGMKSTWRTRKLAAGKGRVPAGLGVGVLLRPDLATP
jgi:hypothetical protein